MNPMKFSFLEIYPNGQKKMYKQESFLADRVLLLWDHIMCFIFVLITSLSHSVTLRTHNTNC